MTPFISALINELATSIELQDGCVTAVVPNLRQDVNFSNKIQAKAKRDPFTTEIIVTEASSIQIDGRCLKNINDLVVIGFDPQQLDLLEQNVSATVYLEEIYEMCKTQHPIIIDIIEKLVNIKIDFKDTQNHAGLATLFSRLPQREAFILSDTCGNIDGSTGNPLKNVMFGKYKSLIQYHPIPIAFYEGQSKLFLVKFDPRNIKSMGKICQRLNTTLSFIKSGFFPMNSYAYKILNEEQSISTSESFIETFTLLSKRSFVPIENDYQIKTSFPAQITSEKRTIDWNIGRDVMHSSHIVLELARKKLLPDNFWVLSTQYMSQANNDERTTFFIRDGLQDARSNSTVIGIPNTFTPITACALTSRNILTPGKTLMESMIEFGFDGQDLFRNISRKMIHTQLDLMKLGWIPDSHTQNVVYLFDFKRKVFAGVLQRDAECEKLDLNKLRSKDIPLPLSTDFDPKLLRNIVYNDEKLITLYLHHTIYTKHIVPMAHILHEKYDIPALTLCEYVRRCLLEWQEVNSDCDIAKEIDFSDRFYERNLACKSLKIGTPPHYRLIYNHPLLPKRFSNK